MEKMYMVRAGEKAYYYSEFIDKNIVGIGWKDLGNLKDVDNMDKLRALMAEKYPLYGKQKLNNGQVKKLLFDMKINDYVITYNSDERVYSIGIVKSDYIYNENINFPNIRNVEWKGKVSRDILSYGGHCCLLK